MLDSVQLHAFSQMFAEVVDIFLKNDAIFDIPDDFKCVPAFGILEEMLEVNEIERILTKATCIFPFDEEFQIIIFPFESFNCLH